MSDVQSGMITIDSAKITVLPAQGDRVMLRQASANGMPVADLILTPKEAKAIAFWLDWQAKQVETDGGTATKAATAERNRIVQSVRERADDWHCGAEDLGIGRAVASILNDIADRIDTGEL